MVGEKRTLIALLLLDLRGRSTAPVGGTIASSSCSMLIAGSSAR